jgi:hypothetical protein
MSAKLFPSLMRALAAGLAVAAPQVVESLIAYFQGGAPSDVSPTVWAIVSGVVIFALNFVLGKLRAPQA